MRRHRSPIVPPGGGRAARGAIAARGLHAARRALRDKRGAAAFVTAAAAASLLAVTGLAVDVGNWYLLHRRMQAAADLAALAGVLQLDGGSARAAEDAAKSVTSRSGFIGGSNQTTVSAASNLATGRIVVTVERPQTSGLLRAAGISNPGRTVRAQATAEIAEAGARPCVLALVGSIYVNNNADLAAPSCSLASNSGEADAFDLKNGNGKGRISAAHIVTHGGCEGCVNAMENGRLSLPSGVTPNTYANKVTTEYAYLNQTWSPPASATSKCRGQPNADNKTKKIQLTPGCYEKVDIKPSESAEMTPGVYYIYDGSLVVKGELKCPSCKPGEGVSIVMVGKNGGTPGQVDISAQADVRLNASRQADSALDGVLLYSHDPNGHQSGNGGGRNDIDFNAGSKVRLDGAIVSFTSRLRLTGGAQTDSQSCTVFVVASVELKGNSAMNLAATGCDAYSTKTRGARIPRLVPS